MTLTTIATVSSLIVIVASVIGIWWSRSRARVHRGSIQSSRELDQLNERIGDAEKRAEALKTKTSRH